MGVPLRELIYEYAGGMRRWQRLSRPSSLADHRRRAVRATQSTRAWTSIGRAAGSSLGSAGVIVMDEDTDMVSVALSLMRFYAHESCGKCTPCRIGTSRMVDILERLVRHKGSRATWSAWRHWARR